MPRRLDDYVTAFCNYGQTFNSTPLYLEAAALWQLGTSVGRAVAMAARGNSLSPNMYGLLIGGPGTGKSQAIVATRTIVFPALKRSFIPASITRAGLEDYMERNLVQRRSPDGKMLMSNECLGLAEELQGILPEYDISHLNLYTTLYDLPPLHIAVTRSSGEKKLNAPYCSILCGAQPAYLALQLPEHAWGMGFMSRSMMIFDTKPDRKSIFELESIDRPQQAKLIEDLATVSNLCGWMKWTEEARHIYEVWWVKNGGPPVPTAKRLATGYNARRETHFLRIAMAYSLSRTDDLIVDAEDVRRAISFMLKAENRMVHVFQEMTHTGAMVALEDVLEIIRNRAQKGQSVNESEIVQFLMERFPATQVHALIDRLVESGMLKTVGGKGIQQARGLRQFTAGDRMTIA